MHESESTLLMCGDVQNASAASSVGTIRQLVDDLAALLAAAVLQLLGGACASPAAAGKALQVGRAYVLASTELCWSILGTFEKRVVGGQRCRRVERLSGHEVSQYCDRVAAVHAHVC